MSTDAPPLSAASTPLSVFDQYDAGDVRHLVDAFPFAWVIAADGFTASQLPLVGCYDEAGELTEIVGHFALSNPLHAALLVSPVATVLFSGPQAYISPADAGNRQWGPTWNHAHLRLRAQITIDAGFTHAALDLLVAHVEQGKPDPWRSSELGARYDAMAARIIGFRGRVIQRQARFKLGQDETPATLANILATHENRELANWMEAFNSPRQAEVDHAAG